MRGIRREVELASARDLDGRRNSATDGHGAQEHRDQQDGPDQQLGQHDGRLGRFHRRHVLAHDDVGGIDRAPLQPDVGAGQAGRGGAGHPPVGDRQVQLAVVRGGGAVRPDRPDDGVRVERPAFRRELESAATAGAAGATGPARLIRDVAQDAGEVGIGLGSQVARHDQQHSCRDRQVDDCHGPARRQRHADRRAHLDVDGVRAQRIGLVRPGMLGDRLAIHHGRGSAHEQLEDQVLGAGQVERPTPGGHRAAEWVERDAALLEDRTLHTSWPALQGPHPREQLAEVEGFDEVVVRPGVEAPNPVGRRITGGEHQQGCRPLVATHPGDDVDPLGPGHAPVDDRDVVLVPLHLVDGVIAALDGVNLVPGFSQPQRDDRLQSLIVLCDEDAHQPPPCDLKAVCGASDRLCRVGRMRSGETRRRASTGHTSTARSARAPRCSGRTPSRIIG